MIVTVTPNAALDVTYHVERLGIGATNRVTRVRERAGGKGVNVARVLALLGEPVTVTGLAGGRVGDEIRAGLRADRLTDAMRAVAAPSRRTVTVVDDAGATVLAEPGPFVTAEEWLAFRAAYADLIATADVVVLSGSLPPGVPVDAYAELVAEASRAGVPSIVDAAGEPLLAACAAGPALVKPNADELRETTGMADPRAASDRLRSAGAGTVVASLGAAGLLATTDDGRWAARLPSAVRGNPTGAGDAAVAALAACMTRAGDWPERLREAVALSAAAVLADTAGSIDLAAYRELLPSVTVERI